MSTTNENMPDSVDQAGILLVLSAIKHSPEFKPNWNEVAKDVGMGYARNVPPKFNNLIRKFGYKYEKGVFSGPDDGDDGNTSKKVDGDKKGGKAKKAKPATPKATPKKRKVAEAVEDASEEEAEDEVKNEDE